jgi:hypothetical protein
LTAIDHGIFSLDIVDNLAVMEFNPEGDRYPDDLVNEVYTRECRYLERLSRYSWAPQNIHLLKPFRQICFEWYGNTCEDWLPKDYKEQLEQIVSDLHKEQIYKPSFYPKYFYSDKNGQLHAYAFYSSSDYSEQPIHMDFYKPILNPRREELVNFLLGDSKTLDMGLLVERAFTDYIKWPEDALKEIYNKVYR